MAPIFDRKDALASPYPPTNSIGSLALEFAVLGQVDLARDLVSILTREYPLHGIDLAIRQLPLAWQLTGKWPEGATKFEDDEEREEFEQELDAELWPDEIDEEECTTDEAGLKRMLEFLKALSAESEGAEGSDASLEATKSAALVKALDISLKIAEDKAGKKAPLEELDEQSQKLLKQISERMHCLNQSEALAGCAHLWPYLARGDLAKAIGTKTEKLEELGKTIKETITEWFSRGPSAPAKSDKSLKELLQTCSDRSKEFWAEEYSEPAPETLFAASGATEKEIAELESKLETKFPADYKEFLGFSNGFKQVIADGVFEDIEAPLHATSAVAWRKADELITNVDEDDEDDEDGEDGGDGKMEAEAAADSKESRPAKKMKLADGAEALTKEADDARDSEDEDEDEAAGLEWLSAQMNAFNIDLLPLPSSVHLGLAEENDDKWPEIERVLEVGGDDDSYLWLLPPDQVKTARDAYINVLDNTEDEQLKKALRWAMIAFAGSEEAFRKFDDWAFVAWSGGQMHSWPSFRRYVEELTDTCLKLEKVEDEEATAKAETLAYSCR